MKNPNPWRIYLISDMKTWSHDMGYVAPTEHFDSVDLAMQRYNQIRPEQTAYDPADLTYSGIACARMTIGIERENGASATDLLQVRYGRNVLCDDFTRKERICQGADALGLIATLSERIKFDLVMAVTDDGRPHITLPQQWGSPYLHVAFPDIKQPDYLKQFASLQGDGYMILQLKQTDDTRELRFEPYRRVKEQIDVANYVPMYVAPLQIQHDVNVTLEWLFGTFNGTVMRIPDDFHGHSLSVSDVVLLRHEGQITAHYVDSFGFAKLPDFNPLRTMEDMIEQNDNQLDGIVNSLSKPPEKETVKPPSILAQQREAKQQCESRQNHNRKAPKRAEMER